MSDSLRPHGLYNPWNSPGQNTGVGTIPSPADLADPGIELGSPALQADSLPTELSGKLMAGVGGAEISNLLFMPWFFWQPVSTLKLPRAPVILSAHRRHPSLLETKGVGSSCARNWNLTKCCNKRGFCHASHIGNYKGFIFILI